ncbi:hypothetical protein BDF19DRAFT_433151 [Syncephalis fuscata]|nr:hypothetical protein BDF19DRAFT_433151 [Syncephalis fuscata]
MNSHRLCLRFPYNSRISLGSTLRISAWPHSRLLTTTPTATATQGKGTNRYAKNKDYKRGKDSMQTSRSKTERPNYFEDPYLLTEKLNRLVRTNRLEEAFELVKEAPKRAQSPVVWNELIQAYARAQQGKKAWQAYNQMKKRGLTPTGQTYTNLLNALARSPIVNVALADKVLRKIADAPSETDSIEDLCGRLSQTHLNVAIKVYAAAADVERLDQIVRALRTRQRIDAIAATTLITTFARMNDFDRAWDIWKNDVRLGNLKVDSVLVGAILMACSRVTAKDSQHRAFFIADHYLGLGEQVPSSNTDSQDLLHAPEVHLAPTPANMDLLMLCCARLKQSKRGYQYFIRALDRHRMTGSYQPDMRNFLSATGLILSSIHETKESSERVEFKAKHVKNERIHQKQ